MNVHLFVFALLGALYISYCNCIYLVNATNKNDDNPAFWTEEGVWGPLLEEWALTGTHREKRVMQLPPPANNAYVIDDDKNSGIESVKDAKESKISLTKIVNNDSNRKPPGRQVSETDLYLLGAIEKLVYRVDFMEKRLRRVEEMLYYVTAGNRIDHQEPCPNNFTRIGASCYLFSYAAGREYDWKVASKQCKRVGGVLAELETIEEKQDVIIYIQNNQNLRGKDFWLGGLNPGLLWIWSNTARPILTSNKNDNKKNPSMNILGDGRCLRLAYDPALRSYVYRGTDCAIRFSFICEIQESTSSNEIRRLGKSRKIFDEL